MVKMLIDYEKPPTAGNKGYLSAKKAAVGGETCARPRGYRIFPIMQNREGRATSRMAARLS